jgi:hypothetical protein
MAEPAMPPSEAPAPPHVVPGTPVPSTERGFYEPYSGFARTLRTWLIAFGVGAPIVFFQSPSAWAALSSDGSVRPFVYCFLAGIALQVVCALLYKTSMWYLYMEELDEVKENDWRCRAARWLSTAYWLELAFDLASIALFAYATLRAIRVIAA